MDTIICQNINTWIKYKCVTESKRNRLSQLGYWLGLSGVTTDRNHDPSRIKPKKFFKIKKKWKKRGGGRERLEREEEEGGEMKYIYWLMTHLFSITKLFSTQPHARGRQGQALQILPTWEVFNPLGNWESVSQTSQEKFHSFSLFLSGLCT